MTNDIKKIQLLVGQEPGTLKALLENPLSQGEFVSKGVEARVAPDDELPPTPMFIPADGAGIEHAYPYKITDTPGDSGGAVPEVHPESESFGSAFKLFPHAERFAALVTQAAAKVRVSESFGKDFAGDHEYATIPLTMQDRAIPLPERLQIKEDVPITRDQIRLVIRERASAISQLGVALDRLFFAMEMRGDEGIDTLVEKLAKKLPGIPAEKILTKMLSNPAFYTNAHHGLVLNTLKEVRQLVEVVSPRGHFSYDI